MHKLILLLSISLNSYGFVSQDTALLYQLVSNTAAELSQLMTFFKQMDTFRKKYDQYHRSVNRYYWRAKRIAWMAQEAKRLREMKVEDLRTLNRALRRLRYNINSVEYLKRELEREHQAMANRKSETRFRRSRFSRHKDEAESIVISSTQSKPSGASLADINRSSALINRSMVDQNQILNDIHDSNEAIVNQNNREQFLAAQKVSNQYRYLGIDVPTPTGVMP